jgi:hypothetical protein
MFLPLMAITLGATTVVPLQISASVSQSTWVSQKDRVELAVTITNVTEQSITVLTTHAGGRDSFFDLKIVDASGKVIRSGDETRFMAVRDLPAPVFHTLAPHESYRAVVNFSILFNLAPGSYQISGIYRVQPEREPHVDGAFAGEIAAQHAFVGRLESSPLSVVVTR